MPSISHTVVYVFLFVSLYFEVFLLVTYLEKRSQIKEEDEAIKLPLSQFPSTTIIVPCWNEENTVERTVESLLGLDYPKDKLKIILVDDGSKDNTWQVMQKFQGNSQIEIYRKENGGKHSAVNFGLTLTSSELVGCLDADSYVDSQALKNIIPYFSDPKVMAVAPSIKVYNPKGVIQLMQKVSYHWGIFIRKMFSYLGAMYVTPGPFSIFRKEVFDKLGGYRYAHQTEDMEIAMRLQANHYTIVNSHNAVVHTVAPDTLKKLYKQQLRWTYGFINNALDYKHVFFKREYGNLGMYVLPMAGLSVGSGIYIILMTINRFLQLIGNQILKIQTIGFSWKSFNFDWFYINTEIVAVATILAFMGTISLLFIARKMADGKTTPGFDMVYYLAIYPFLAPLWLGKAVWNTIFSVKTTWR